MTTISNDGTAGKCRQLPVRNHSCGSRAAPAATMTTESAAKPAFVASRVIGVTVSAGAVSKRATRSAPAGSTGSK
jgi:hypothetical protein